MPLYSIITVTYQNLAGLRKTEASVTEQTCLDYEWIIIDGGSDDGTVEYIQDVILSESEGSRAGYRDSSATPQNDRCQILSEPDHGIYDAMNKGIDRASGDYVIFMNAGDRFAAPDTLADIKQVIDNAGTPPDFLYGDALEEQGNGAPVYKAARYHSQWRYGMFTHHQAMIYNRNAVTDAALRYDTNYRIAADYKFTIQFIGNYRNVSRIKDSSLCVFEQNGISQNHVRESRKEQFAIRKECGGTPSFQNIMIYAAQTLVWQLRRFCPSLYWALKKRR